MSPKTTRSANKVPPKKNSTPTARPAKSAAGGRSRKAAEAETPLPTGSKQSQLIALLKAPAGATIEQMRALTGWQAHTVRGAISGVLRRRLGLSVMCAAAVGDSARIYRIVERMGA